ncbi:DUF4407 domain-containing protein [Streptosporangium sp. NBC_01755]|uniref:DUF4407 domain-containing protein n=1 Tax=unclassified Streptosporangium TaxID=2632669 RepID=UPI002DD8F4DC|nr:MULTISPECIES: DUF4407 domain-containing protein [unclassified Streptosporangium]WSA26663.1 DUF4407 domain-containing protein [Streptosporangium sp. NBC_01810]WSD01913.1 DUF4407 domain-containing protein [Streptosporangium sp. NBC_01755]
MRTLLIALSGARPEVLKLCPTEQGKFEGIGGAVLTTSVLAVVSMTFALNSALGVSLVLAIPASLVWGLAIMSLDRWLVSTMHADGPRRWRVALPRILMAVLLGLVISTPLVLQIFKSEIDAQIVQIKQQRANEFSTRQSTGSVAREVARLRTETTALQNVITSEGDVPLDPAKDPKIKSLTAERGAQQTQTKKLYDEWQCQLYGGKTCPRKGDGPLAQASKRAYEKAQSQVDLLTRQIEDRKSELTATDESSKKERLDQATQDLPKVQESLDAAVRRQSDLQNAFDAENRATNGLLIRLQALNEASGKDFTLRSTHLLLFLLFLLIECLPVAIKLMQKPGNYEKILNLAAKQEFRDARDSYRSQFGSSAPSPGSATQQDADDDSASIWDIWEEPDPLRATRRVQTPAGQSKTMHLTDPQNPDNDHYSAEDDMLRAMPNTRAFRRSDSAGPAGERPGRIELFPDDDD